MFGLKRIRQLEADKLQLEIENSVLLSQLTKQRSEWNVLIHRINKLGGENFLQNGELKIQQRQFDDEDLRRLLQLCHPDKHNNSPLAVTMTTKLNQARS